MMNKKIQKMMVEAGYNPEDGGVFKFDDFIPEKFAELIVRECANVAHTCIDDEWFDVGGAILDHFGVEK